MEFPAISSSRGRRNPRLQVNFIIIIALLLAIVAVEVKEVEAKERLPARAFVNRTLYPKLIYQSKKQEEEEEVASVSVDGVVNDKAMQEAIRRLDLEVDKGGANSDSPEGGESKSESESERAKQHFQPPHPQTRPDDLALSIALFADAQSAAGKAESGRRHYAKSAGKMMHMVNEWRANWSNIIDVCVNIGDVVEDRFLQRYPPLKPILDSISISTTEKNDAAANADADATVAAVCPHFFHVLGNHDYDSLGSLIEGGGEERKDVEEKKKENKKDTTAEHQMLSALDMPHRYYSRVIRTPTAKMMMLKKSKSSSISSNDKKKIENDDDITAAAEAKAKKQKEEEEDEEYRLIFLDSNDISTYATTPGTEKHTTAKSMLHRQKKNKKHGVKNGQDYNGALGSVQLAWLRTELEAACGHDRPSRGNNGKQLQQQHNNYQSAAEIIKEKQQQNVVIFIHAPLLPLHGSLHTLWNNEEIVTLIESYPQCVLAVISGHTHKWDYEVRYVNFTTAATQVPAAQEPRKQQQHTRKLHYITYAGLVQSPFISYGFVDFFPSEEVLVVHGLAYGQEIHFRMDTSTASTTIASSATTSIVGGASSSSSILTPHNAKTTTTTTTSNGDVEHNQKKEVDHARYHASLEDKETNEFVSESSVLLLSGLAVMLALCLARRVQKRRERQQQR